MSSSRVFSSISYLVSTLILSYVHDAGSSQDLGESAIIILWSAVSSELPQLSQLMTDKVVSLWRTHRTDTLWRADTYLAARLDSLHLSPVCRGEENLIKLFLEKNKRNYRVHPRFLYDPLLLKRNKMCVFVSLRCHNLFEQLLILCFNWWDHF